ncbi:MAG: hypothetical protein HUJ90_05550 [Bacteroidales bacterium]|nr:hypothetical protein [Bacteroidales bacterium]
MKRFCILLFLLISFAYSLDAQTEASPVPDSVLYILPEFTQGKVYYKDGRVASGNINVSSLDNNVYMKDKSGTLMQIADNELVSRVIAGDIQLHKYYERFIRLIDNNGKIYLCYAKMMIIDDAQEAAYGGKNYTNSIQSMATIYNDRKLINLAPDVEYELKYVPYLYDGAKYYIASKNNMIKCFPGKKDFINSYNKEHKVNFDDFMAVQELFELLKTN